MHAGLNICFVLQGIYNFLTLFHISSVVDPDSLNPDTDPDVAFQVNLDPDTDPGF